MTQRAGVSLLLALFLAGTATAQEQQGEIIPERQKIPQMELPSYLRWMVGPTRRGMFIRLPVIDTDPNRGITGGIMPIWVIRGENDERIHHIHAPSLTYNHYFKLSPTYRYYWYPQEDAALVARFSRAKYEHEGIVQYEDRSAFGTDKDIFLRVQNNVDAGQRFFGFGPDSPKSGEANYKEDYWQYRWSLGSPIVPGSAFRARLSQRYQSDRVLDGPIPNLPEFRSIYPQQFADGSQQINETRLMFDYDTRDNTVTTQRGVLAQIYAESALRGYLSAYDYERYGLDFRWFKPQKDQKRVFAVQAKYDQILGPTPPFWVLPSVGGKYSLRAYGDGRYVDRGAAVVNAEERFTFYKAHTAGVSTEFQAAPFIGAGAVFDNPQRAAIRYVRPVAGAAIRAVARPQVVGSVDFGVGREGLAVFTDINYSF